jgi:hypothetical protein
MDDRDDYDDLNIDLGPRHADPRERKGAVLGITSLVLAVINVGLFIVAFIGVSMLPQAQQPGQPAEARVIVSGVGVIGVTIPILAIVGIVLGIIGAFLDNHTGLICAVLGIVFNSLVLITLVVLTCLGVAGMALIAIACFGLANQNQRRRG